MAIKWCARCRKKPVGAKRVKYCDACAVAERRERQRKGALKYYHERKGQRPKRRKQQKQTIKSYRPVPKSRAMRKCLKCRQEFESDGPGHRVCKACKKLNAAAGAVGRFVSHWLT